MDHPDKVLSLVDVTRRVRFVESWEESFSVDRPVVTGPAVVRGAAIAEARAPLCCWLRCHTADRLQPAVGPLSPSTHLRDAGGLGKKTVVCRATTHLLLPASCPGFTLQS